MTTKKSLIQDERLKYASPEFWKELPKVIKQLEKEKLEKEKNTG